MKADIWFLHLFKKVILVFFFEELEVIHPQRFFPRVLYSIHVLMLHLVEEGS